MKRKKLVIISHTEHFLDQGIIKGWGSTVNEVNFLADHWDEVVHVACLHKKTCPKSALPYTKNNIKFVAIPPFGGKNFLDKLKIILVVPPIIKTVWQSVHQASEVQLRLPTSIGVFLLPIFSFFIKRQFIFWVKYAGNWGQEKAPLSYRFQRWWLKNNLAKCYATINGTWPNQPKHCLSFENPCLTKDDLYEGQKIIAKKTFEKPFNFIFIGRLDDAKGVDTIIKSLKELSNDFINQIIFIGDGPKLNLYQAESAFLKDKVQFLGFQNKETIHQLLKKSHFILLPSKSEGFPKVIAEAACYGVIPIVSNVGSIPHYINSENGFVWSIDGIESYSRTLQKAITDKNLLLKSKKLAELAEKFTFESYLLQLTNKILNH